MCEYFFGHVVSAIIASQNRPLPQGTGLSRSRMQNSVARGGVCSGRLPDDAFDWLCQVQQRKELAIFHRK